MAIMKNREIKSKQPYINAWKEAKAAGQLPSASAGGAASEDLAELIAASGISMEGRAVYAMNGLVLENDEGDTLASCSVIYHLA